MSFRVDVEIAIWCESVKPGCTFSARISEGAHAKFYSGQGATAFDAAAWALDDYVRRKLLGRDHIMAVPFDAHPGDGLDGSPAPSSRPRRITPVPPIASDEKSVGADGQCFEQRIPRSSAPRLFTDKPPTTQKRRARGGRR